MNIWTNFYPKPKLICIFQLRVVQQAQPFCKSGGFVLL